MIEPMHATSAVSYTLVQLREVEVEDDADGLEFHAFGTHTPEDRGEFVDVDWPSSR